VCSLHNWHKRLFSPSGASVCNIHAFQVLQSVFLKANSAALCCTILDAISSVYHSDNANYFILEGQHTLSQFAEKIYVKPQEIQVCLCVTPYAMLQHVILCGYGIITRILVLYPPFLKERWAYGIIISIICPL
jgi:hypothetical protein